MYMPWNGFSLEYKLLPFLPVFTAGLSRVLPIVEREWFLTLLCHLNWIFLDFFSSFLIISHDFIEQSILFYYLRYFLGSKPFEWIFSFLFIYHFFYLSFTYRFWTFFFSLVKIKRLWLSDPKMVIRRLRICSILWFRVDGRKKVLLSQFLRIVRMLADTFFAMRIGE